MIGAMIVVRPEAYVWRVAAAADTELVVALASATTRRGHDK
jgi:hypothetical protein